jgi:hypothetical protein
LAVSRCSVAFTIRFLPAFITTVSGSAIPPLSLEMINAGSGVQPYDRVFGAILLGFMFSLELVGAFS